jgi:broad specificity phosphatase PhoE
MARLILVRHGRAAAGWEEEDPGLDDVGREQVAAMTAILVPLGARPVLCSPMRRCRETAAPLAEAWGVEVAVEPAVTELPSPSGVATRDRPAWLRRATRGTWADLDDEHRLYRAGVLARLAEVAEDSVVVSHFLAINVVVGAALADERVVVLRPDNASRTVVDVDDTGFHLVEGGEEADTLIR